MKQISSAGACRRKHWDSSGKRLLGPSAVLKPHERGSAQGTSELIEKAQTETISSVNSLRVPESSLEDLGHSDCMSSNLPHSWCTGCLIVLSERCPTSKTLNILNCVGLKLQCVLRHEHLEVVGLAHTTSPWAPLRGMYVQMTELGATSRCFTWFSSACTDLCPLASCLDMCVGSSQVVTISYRLMAAHLLAHEPLQTG